MARGRAEGSYGSPQAFRLGSISTSHQQEWPRLPWLQQSPALGQGFPGQSPRTPPVLTVQPGDSPGHGGALCPQRAEAVSPAVCLSTKAQVGPTWPRVSKGGPKLGKGWPQRSSPAGGSRCSWGSACPYLPGRGEGSRGTAAASPMAARTWPETPASGSSLSSRRVPSRPLGIWGWVVLSLISPSAAAQCEIWLWREKGGEKRIM